MKKSELTNLVVLLQIPAATRKICDITTYITPKHMCFLICFLAIANVIVSHGIRYIVFLGSMQMCIWVIKCPSWVWSTLPLFGFCVWSNPRCGKANEDHSLPHCCTILVGDVWLHCVGKGHDFTVTQPSYTGTLFIYVNQEGKNNCFPVFCIEQ